MKKILIGTLLSLISASAFADVDQQSVSLVIQGVTAKVIFAKMQQNNFEAGGSIGSFNFVGTNIICSVRSKDNEAYTGTSADYNCRVDGVLNK